MKRKVEEGTIVVAPRELRRMVNAAVGRSFSKTITEPVTNSYANLKFKASLSHKAGLIDQILAVPEGQRLDTSTLKAKLPKHVLAPIIVYVSTHGATSRLTRIIDSGTGMTADELKFNFGQYAEAKAKGLATRSLFGRGALDVLLYHQDSEIYSVKNGILARCVISLEGKTKWKVEELGTVTKVLLRRHGLPDAILPSGTVVQFRLRKEANIPQEDQIVARLSNFYMLRLIAADPNIDVVIERDRKSVGKQQSKLQYDFPVGTVIAKPADTVELYPGFLCPIDVLVARCDDELKLDPLNIEQRDGGLLFVDENDAVLDLTLLPEYDKNPNLRHLYGVVRITGIRPLLEKLLEDRDAEAVLTVSRDGFDQRNAVTKTLFSAVERLVKSIYTAEEQRVRRNRATRSAQLEQRMRDTLKIINQFNAEETEEKGGRDGETTADGKTLEEKDPIFFDVRSTRLYATMPKRLYAYVNLTKVDSGELVMFESSNPEIKVLPDSTIVEQVKDGLFAIPVTVTCNVKSQTGEITAITLNKEQETVRASAIILGVDEPPVTYIPESIEFTSHRYAGDPNRDNKAILLVNMEAFPGKPEVTFALEKVTGDISFKDGTRLLKVRVRDEDLSENGKLARLVITYRGTGWGQGAWLTAKAKMKDGAACYASCKLRFVRENESDKFNKIWYEDMRESSALGDVVSDALYINAAIPLHREIFGETQEEFDAQLESNAIAQMRAASVLAEVVVYHTAQVKYKKGGKGGLHLDSDPITSMRKYLDESRKQLERSIVRRLAPEAVALFTH